MLEQVNLKNLRMTVAYQAMLITSEEENQRYVKQLSVRVGKMV